MNHMSRVIKFRAWDTKKLQWIGFNDIKFGANGASAVVYYDPERGDVVQAGLFELMQFTGLLDKNGVEIYEGDIVAYTSDKPETIEFIEGAFCFSSGWTLHDLITPPNENKAEVIGNIYEAPDLLNSDQQPEELSDHKPFVMPGEQPKAYRASKFRKQKHGPGESL